MHKLFVCRNGLYFEVFAHSKVHDMRLQAQGSPGQVCSEHVHAWHMHEMQVSSCARQAQGSVVGVVAMSPAHGSRHHATQLWVVCCRNFSQIGTTHHAQVALKVVVV